MGRIRIYALFAILGEIPVSDVFTLPSFFAGRVKALSIFHISKQLYFPYN
jgi:hypothetical protein